MSLGDDTRVNVSDFSRIPYPEQRAALLSRWNDGCDEIEWLVDAGAYLRACWLAEAEDLGDDPLDEDRTKPLWDQFRAREIAEQSATARTALRNYVRRNRFADLKEPMAKWLANFSANGLKALFGLLWWGIQAMARGPLGLLGVWLIGLLLLAALPGVYDRMQQAARDFVEQPATSGPG